MRRRRRVDGLHGRYPVAHPRIVHERRVERLRQGEAAQFTAVGTENPGRPADDIPAVHEQDQDVVHAVPVHPFGRRPALGPGPGFDPELMHLDGPMRRAGREPAEQIAAEGQNRPHRRAVADGGVHRREPPSHPAVQRVVVERLIVRPGRRADDGVGNAAGIDGMAPPPIPAAVGHVGVHVEVVPAAGERLPVLEPAKRFERTAHDVGVDEDKPVPHEGGLQRLVRHERRVGHTVILSVRRAFGESRRC